MAERKILRASQPFSVQLADGAPLHVGQGDLYWSDDPAVKGRESLFGEVEVRSSVRSTSSVTGSAEEVATAEPGGRRKVTRPRETNEV